MDVFPNKVLGVFCISSLSYHLETETNRMMPSKYLISIICFKLFVTSFSFRSILILLCITVWSSRVGRNDVTHFQINKV